jgi:hypothetical protein
MNDKAMIRDRIRAQLPGVVTTIRGGDTVVFRYAKRTTTLTHEGTAMWVAFTNESVSGATMAWLSVGRADAFTAGNVAKTIAGFFDAGLSRPEKRP